MYVVAAEYTVKDGKEKDVIDILKKMIPLSRAEPGCKVYMVNQSPEDRRKLLLYEVYVDEDGDKATPKSLARRVLGLLAAVAR